MSREKSSFKSFVLGAIIGAAVGAAATLLYMPQTGKKLRRRIKSKGEELGRKLNKLIEESQSFAEEWKTNLDKLSSGKSSEEESSEEESSEPVAAEKKEVKKSSSELVAEAESSEPAESAEPDKLVREPSPRKRKLPRFFKGI